MCVWLTQLFFWTMNYSVSKNNIYTSMKQSQNQIFILAVSNGIHPSGSICIFWTYAAFFFQPILKQKPASTEAEWLDFISLSLCPKNDTSNSKPPGPKTKSEFTSRILTRIPIFHAYTSFGNHNPFSAVNPSDHSQFTRTEFKPVSGTFCKVS